MTWTLHLGDCIEGMAGLADKSVDHVIADPPYSAHVHAKQWIGHTLTAKGAARCATNHSEIGFAHLTTDDRSKLAQQYARLARRWVLVFCDIEGVDGWRLDLESAGLDYVRTLVWDKVDSAPQFTGDRPANSAECAVLAHRPGRKKWNGGGKRNVYRVPVNGGTGAKAHPTQKPLALMQALVSDFTDHGDLVLDSHAGSGTTGEACINLGRRFIGFERDPKHFATAQARLERACRQESLFATTGRDQLSLGVTP